MNEDGITGREDIDDASCADSLGLRVRCVIWGRMLKSWLWTKRWCISVSCCWLGVGWQSYWLDESVDEVVESSFMAAPVVDVGDMLFNRQIEGVGDVDEDEKGAVLAIVAWLLSFSSSLSGWLWSSAVRSTISATISLWRWCRWWWGWCTESPIISISLSSVSSRISWDDIMTRSSSILALVRITSASRSILMSRWLFMPSVFGRWWPIRLFGSHIWCLFMWWWW